jgi:hypothetical protein
MRKGVLKDPKLWIGLLSSALFVYLALRGVEPARIAQALKEADYRFVPPASLLCYGVLWFRSLRWKILLRGVKEVPTGSLFRATIIGFMANYLLPARLGELVRAYVVGAREEVSRSAVFATVVVERILDVFSILLVFLGVSLLGNVPQGSPELEGALRASAVVLFGVAVAVVGLLWVLRRRTAWFTSALRGTLGRFSSHASERLSRVVESFAQGISPIQRGRDLVGIGLYTIILWLLSAAVVVLIAEGFRLGLPWEASWLILVALAFGVSVPSAPGFVGTFHYAAVLCLSLYGVQRSEALSFAIVLHATHLIPIVLLGLVLLWGEGLTLGRIARMKKGEGERRRT